MNFWARNYYISTVGADEEVLGTGHDQIDLRSLGNFRERFLFSPKINEKARCQVMTDEHNQPIESVPISRNCTPGIGNAHNSGKVLHAPWPPVPCGLWNHLSKSAAGPGQIQ